MFGISAFSEVPFSSLSGGGVLNAAADINSVSSITTNSIGIFVVSATPTSESTVSCAASVIKSAQAEIVSTSSIQASVALIVLCSANVDSVSTVTCSTSLTRGISAFIAGDAVVTVSARLKWEDSLLIAESWTTISDQSESWTDISDQSETWTVTTQ